MHRGQGGRDHEVRLHDIGRWGQHIGDQILMGRDLFINLTIDFGIAGEVLNDQSLTDDYGNEADNSDAYKFFNTDHGAVSERNYRVKKNSSDCAAGFRRSVKGCVNQLDYAFHGEQAIKI